MATVFRDIIGHACAALVLNLILGAPFASCQENPTFDLPKMDRLDLGFEATSMSLSHDGKLAAVWGMSLEDRNRKPSSPGRDELAIIDVEQGKVLKKKTFPQGVRSAAIDHEFVYVCPNSGSLVYRLDHSGENAKRLFLKLEPVRLMKISNQRLVIVGKRSKYQVVDRERLAPVSGLMSMYGDYGRQLTIHYLTANEIRLGNRVIDYENGNLLRIETSSKLPVPNLNNEFSKRRNAIANSGAVQESRGRQINSRSLMNDQRHSIASWPDPEIVAISRFHPLAGVVSEVRRGKTNYKILDLRGSLDGAVVASFQVDSWNMRDRRRSRDSREFVRLTFSEHKVFVLSESSLCFASIDDFVADLESPIHFLAKQQTEVDVGNKIAFDLAVSDMGDGIEFQLLVEAPGISLDKSTGRIEIDTPLVWEQVIKYWSDPKTQIHFRGSKRQLLWEREANVENYHALTGKDLREGALAAAIPISAILRQPEGQEDMVDFCVILVGSRAKLAEAIARRDIEVADTQQGLYKRLLQAEAISRSSEIGEKLSDRSTEKRLDLIEVRLNRIEGAIDSLLKKLDE